MAKKEAKKSKKTLTLRTAMLYRRHGIFKKAERDVYQDLQAGDLWKLSEDKTKIERLFEDQNGITEA